MTNHDIDELIAEIEERIGQIDFVYSNLGVVTSVRAELYGVIKIIRKHFGKE
jgi:NAD(P)-dependent dehydrogenase (short-subunit alcohol dehydrogenase family)